MNETSSSTLSALGLALAGFGALFFHGGSSTSTIDRSLNQGASTTARTSFASLPPTVGSTAGGSSVKDISSSAVTPAPASYIAPSGPQGPQSGMGGSPGVAPEPGIAVVGLAMGLSALTFVRFRRRM